MHLFEASLRLTVAVFGPPPSDAGTQSGHFSPKSKHRPLPGPPISGLSLADRMSTSASSYKESPPSLPRRLFAFFFLQQPPTSLSPYFAFVLLSLFYYDVDHRLRSMRPSTLRLGVSVPLTQHRHSQHRLDPASRIEFHRACKYHQVEF